MTLFTSGDWIADCERIITFDLFKYMCNKFDQLKDVEIEVNQVDLSQDNAFGFCQVDESGEFLIHIHNDLVPSEYVKTLAHELIHVRQTIDGLKDNEMREQEAYIWEDIIDKDFWDTYEGGTFFHTPWTNRVYNKKVKQENHE